jgi:hypothetical protein
LAQRLKMLCFEEPVEADNNIENRPLRNSLILLIHEVVQYT